MFYIFAELDIIMKTILLAGILFLLIGHRAPYFLYGALLLITYKKKKYLSFLFVP